MNTSHKEHQGRKVIALRLNHEALELMSKQQATVRLDTGPTPSIVIDGTSFPVKLETETATAHLLYTRDAQDQKRIHLAGTLSHRAMLKQVLRPEDKARTRSRTEAAERERNARRIEFLDIPDIQSLSKPSIVKRTTVASDRGAVSSAKSKNALRRSSSSFPVPSNASTGTLALKERLIHLLSLKPCATRQLASKLYVSENDLEPLLPKVAVNVGKAWGLRPEMYKNLQIWDATLYDEKERDIVLQNAKDAYDLLNLPKHAPERANLVRPKYQNTSPHLQQRRSTQPELPMNARGSVKRSMSVSAAPETFRTNKARVVSHAQNGRKAMPVRLSEMAPASPKHSDMHTNTSPPTPTATLLTEPSHPASSTCSSTLSPSSISPTFTHAASNSSDTASTTSALSSAPPTHASLSDDDSSEDAFSDLEDMPPYIPPPIRSQSEFDELCKEHDNSQRQYSRLKRRISEEHPVFIEALVEADPAEADDNEQMYRKIRLEYKLRGGDMSQWHSVLRQSRHFLWQLRKTCSIWDELERTHRQCHYQLPVRQRGKK